MLIKVCEYNTSLEYHGYIIKIWDNTKFHLALPHENCPISIATMMAFMIHPKFCCYRYSYLKMTCSYHKYFNCTHVVSSYVNAIVVTVVKAVVANVY